MSKKIKFIPNSELCKSNMPAPISSKSLIPEWYKKIPYKINKKYLWVNPKGQTNLTVKSCIPVFDALTSGYIITTPADVYVTNDPAYPKFMWEVSWNIITGHSPLQMGDMPMPEGFSGGPYKWEVNWSIETPKGYSLLFTHPFYNFDLPFITLTGISDNDDHKMPVNLPFLLKDNFEGLIPKGTPIAQIIPIKRDNWNSEIKDYNKNASFDIDMIKSIVERSYKKTIWKKKNYD
jgi:hypothetical protein